MYRSFTGEAYSLLIKRKDELEIRQLLWDRYVKEVVVKQVKVQPLLLESAKTKRTYRKQDTNYWESKTRRSIKRKGRIQQRQRYAGLLAEASKVASAFYRELPVQSRKRSHYQELTGWAMRLLKEQDQEVTTALAQPAVLPDSINIAKKQRKTNEIGYINYQKGFFAFISPIYKYLYRDGRRYLNRSGAPYSSSGNIIIPQPMHPRSIYCLHQLGIRHPRSNDSLRKLV